MTEYNVKSHAGMVLYTPYKECKSCHGTGTNADGFPCTCLMQVHNCTGCEYKNIIAGRDAVIIKLQAEIEQLKKQLSVTASKVE